MTRFTFEGQGRTTGGGGGGIGLVVVAVVIGLVILGAATKPAGTALRSAGRLLSEIGHIIVLVIEIAIITVASAAAVAAAAALVWAGVRLHRWHSARQARSVPMTLRAEVIPATSAKQAIEGPKPRADLYLVPEVTDDRPADSPGVPCARRSARRSCPSATKAPKL